MKRGISLRGRSIKIFLIIILVLLLIAILIGGYILFFKIVKCESTECFNSNLAECRKANFLRNTEDAAWSYTIVKNSKENPGDSCIVDVVLVKLKHGNVDSEILEGKEMTCDYFKGNEGYPEEDLTRCTGVLKEEIQDLIIKRTHDYLLKNLEDINEVV